MVLLPLPATPITTRTKGSPDGASGCMAFLPRRGERRKRQRDARHERLEAGVLDADHPTLLFEQRRSMREQRSGVPIGGEPHQHELEQRPRRIERVAAVEALELGLVAAR